MELIFILSTAMGHLPSAIELAHNILRHDNHLSITILIINAHTISPKVTSFIDSKSTKNPYPTRLTFHSLPPLSNPPDPSSPDYFKTILDLHKPLVKQAVEDRFNVRSSGLAGFVIDMFFTNFIELANDLNVPCYTFFSSGANFLNLMFHAQSLADDHGIDVATKFNDPESEFDIPGFRTRVSGKAIPAVLVDNKEPGTKTILNITRSYKKCKGILLNTFKELESCVVEALLDLVAKGSIPSIYPVGPLLELDERSRGEVHESTMEWLDNQPLASVVFVCFGSMGAIDRDQVKELAEGLENSGHRFLWSLRKPPTEGRFEMPSDEAYVDALPEGFLDRTGECGKVIGWAPQVSILAHSAIGGFVSHCGWNSTLESLWFGVPMGTWPFGAEQNLNAFELVQELGLAVEIRMDHRYDFMARKSNFIVKSEDIEYGVKKLMNLDGETKDRIRQISDKSRKALEEGGSSYEWLRCFIEDVVKNVG